MAEEVLHGQLTTLHGQLTTGGHSLHGGAREEGDHHQRKATNGAQQGTRHWKTAETVEQHQVLQHPQESRPSSQMGCV